MNKLDEYEDDIRAVRKDKTRHNLWDLRDKYFNKYKALQAQLPSSGFISGSTDYVRSMLKIDTQVCVYAEAIQDIDKILGV